MLDLAEVKRGDVVLDVGCGDGLIGLGALDRGARVIFSDISQPCLDDCRAVAGPDADAEYRLAPATDLGDVEADVVTTRSVLIYVADKRTAFAELFRVLRPGGRLAIFEPINRFGLEERRKTLGFGDVTGIEELLARVYDEMTRVEEELGGLQPMIDFDERDLLALAEEAGFVDLRLKYLADIQERPREAVGDWETFANIAPNPLAPTLLEAIDATLTPEEATRLIAVLRPQVEQGRMASSRFARAFLAGRKPG